jgi:RNA polymerase sigma-70 factor (ECF subfamily)
VAQRTRDQPVARRPTDVTGSTPEAWRDLVPLVYDELRRQARRYLRKERAGHTLQTTALVHEAYLRLSHQRPKEFANREHFLAVSAQLMRQILVEHARRRSAIKRGGDAITLALDEAGTFPPRQPLDVIALDDALTALAAIDPRQSRIVEFRFFTGLSIDETSHVLGLSPATVKREWMTARAWLQREMTR